MRLCVTRILMGCLLLATAQSAAQAATRVNVCQNDSAFGPGLTNLGDALSVGGDIRIDCPAGSVLRVTRSHRIARSARVDGRGATLLVDRDALPAFTVGRGVVLVVRNVELRGSGPVPTGRTPGLATFVVGRGGTVRLEQVTARRLARPALLMDEARLDIRQTRFVDGTDPIRVDGGILRISDASSFEDWGTAVRASGGDVGISNTTFRKSRLELDKCRFAIADSEFRDNDVRAAGLSGGALDLGCDGRIDRSLFVNNRAVNGGAIHLRSQANDVMLFRVRMFNNVATADGGALHRPAFVAIRQYPPLQIAYSVFRANRARDGGAIFVPDGIVHAHAVHVAGNSASRDGGGIFASALRIGRGTVVGNTAGRQGGGLRSYVEQHPFAGLTTNVVANTLVVRNTAPQGAGIFGSAMRITNSTIAENSGVGLSGGAARVQPAITITNSLVTANSGGNCAPAQGADGAISASGPNLQFPGASCPRIPVADPTLDPLFSPVVGSPALGSADLATCAADPVSSRDVYGEPRPQGRGCSIGAVENAVDRLVIARLLRGRQEVDSTLLEQITAIARRLWPSD